MVKKDREVGAREFFNLVPKKNFGEILKALKEKFVSSFLGPKQPNQEIKQDITQSFKEIVEYVKSQEEYTGYNFFIKTPLGYYLFKNGRGDVIGFEYVLDTIPRDSNPPKPVIRKIRQVDFGNAPSNNE